MYNMAGKTIVGLTEPVKIIGQEKEKKVVAKIDTGSEWSSLDMKLASQLQLGPILDTKLIISSHGRSIRPVILALIKIKNRKIRARFNLVDRRKLKTDVLIGLNILRRDFLIDPSKSYKPKK